MVIRDERIAGVLFDFLGFVTTRREAVTLGGEHAAGPGWDLLHEFARNRNLDLSMADPVHWDKYPADRPGTTLGGSTDGNP